MLGRDAAKTSAKSPCHRLVLRTLTAGSYKKKRLPTLLSFEDGDGLNMGGVGKHIHGLHPDEAIFLHEHF